MKVISSIILLFFVAIPIVFGFGGQTKMRIDEIYNNTETNILLKPTNKVEVDYFSGQKALQSTVNGELEESNVTNTELNYLSGVNSNIQDQMDSKVPLTRNIDTTSPLQGGGTLETDKTLSILQSGTAQDGYLSSTDWNTFNDKQNAITGTDGDLYYWNSGLSSLAIGSEFQVLRVSSLGFPEWVDLPISVSVTTKGDLQTYSTQADRLPVGTDGQVLQANSATSTGLEWVDADFYTSPLTTQGDLLYRNATQDTRLPIGTENQVLTVSSSGLPVWSDAQGGGGGSAGINFVVDASFEKEELDLDSSTGATETYETHTTDDKLYSEFNTKYFKSAYTGLSASDLYVRDTFARTGLDGKQGLLSIWIKTDASDLDLCLRTDDATFTNTCDSAYLLNVIGDDTWRKYEIPFVFGSSSVQFEIFNESYTGNANIEVDKIYIGTIPDGYVETVGQAQFVGSATETGNSGCSNIVIPIATFTYYSFPSDSDCLNYSNVGNVEGVDDEVKIIIKNARTDGYYKVSLTSLFIATTSATAAAYQCTFDLSEGSNKFNNTIYTVANSSTNFDDTYENHLYGTYKFDTSGDKTIEVKAASNRTDGQCRVINDSSQIRTKKWEVHFYPDASSTVVSQNTELTAKTANEFSARISSSGVVLSENYDWINGNCVYDSVDGSYGCTLNNLNITNPLACTIGESFTNRNVVYSRTTSTTNLVRFVARLSTTDTVSSADFDVHCSKQGADVNKSATIVGKFENINSSDLVKVEANSTDVETLVNNIVQIIKYENKTLDNYSAYDASTGVFTAPKSGHYFVSASFEIAANITDNEFAIIRTMKNSSIHKSITYEGQAATTKTISMQVDDIIYLDKGETLNVSGFQVSGANANLSQNNFENTLSITELPDTESIIKNLSNQKVECQTKSLSAPIIASGDVSDLTFTNLTVGKKYKIFGSLLCFTSNLTDNVRSCEVQFLENGNRVEYARTQISSTYLRETMNINSIFTATGTIARLNAITLDDQQLQPTGGTSELTLCELPDTYVETTKF
jgi:hypothetical protein